MVLSPRICYVCGGPGASQTLYSRSVQTGAYFPFLESHEAPKGVRPLTKDGAVDTCNICFAFLHQQWESYEKTQTPLVKRLYWLKRLDNRPFTGAEMRMQGEYAAQVMGLQYYPSNTGTMSPYEYSPISSQTKSGAKAGSSDRCSPAPSAENVQGPDDYDEDENGALDLSLTSSTSRDDSMLAEQKAKISMETFLCHTCKTMHSAASKRAVFSMYIKAGEPYFSFLSQTGKSSKKLEYAVCKACKDSLFEQWSIFEYKKLPEHMRNYCIQNSPVFKTSSKHGEAVTGSDSFLSTSGSNEEDVCYICGQLYSKASTKMLNTKPPQDKSSKHSMFFPFIAELKRHPGARPIDKHGKVVSCRACYSYLQRQWQGYQQENVSSRNRKYVLRPLTDTGAETSMEKSMEKDRSIKKEKGEHSISVSDPSSKEDDMKVTAPLNIEINTSSKASAKATEALFPGISNPAEGLLAIAPHISPQMMMSAMYHPGQIFYSGLQGMYNLPSSSGSAKTEATASAAAVVKTGNVAVKQEIVEENPPSEVSYQKMSEKTKTRSRHDQDMKAPTSSSSSSSSMPHTHSEAHHYITSCGRRSESRPSSVYSEASEAASVLSEGRRSHRESSPGLSGTKPPPLNMVPSIPRTTVTVPPLNPVSPGSSITSTASSLSAQGARQNHGSSGAAGNSFAAALRKLAKQAEGPDTSPVDHTAGSDCSATSPRETSGINPAPELTSKRPATAQPAMNYGSHPPHHPLGGVGGSGGHQAPPVVTIAPTPSLSTYMVSERKTAERRTPTNAMLDPLGIKPERDKMTPSHERGSREEDHARSKDSAPLPARITPHPAMPNVSNASGSSSSSLHEELTRGFQPYRTGEEALRHSVLAAAGLPVGMDISSYPMAYAQAAAAAALAAGYPPTSPYAAGHLRMDDPLLLERYRLMQSSMGYSYHPSFMTPVSQYLGAGGRHPAELLSQMGYPYLPPGGKLPDHLSPGAAERLQSEEDTARREHERDAQREREKELERREKEERDRLEKELREREERLEKEQREKERILKEAELRQQQSVAAAAAASSGSSYSSDRHLMYPLANPHEPLNLKRTSEDEHSRAAVALQRQLNGDRTDSERHLNNYRAELSRSEAAALSSRSGLPTLGVPPMSAAAAKPQNLSSHGKDSGSRGSNAMDTHPPTFHRPFEIPGANKSRGSSGGGGGLPSSSGSSTGHGLLATASNGYDRDSYLEYERKLLAEREKMLAEHRASQEKAQQLRTGSSGGGSNSNHGNHGGSHGDGSKDSRASYSVGDTGRLLSERERDRDLKSSSSVHSLSSSSSHVDSKHSLYRSPHKSLLPSHSSGSSTKSHTHQQQQMYSYAKESGNAGNNNKEHQPLTKQSHHHHHHHNLHSGEVGSKSSANNYTSALTSLQNFSNSKVSSGFSSSIHPDNVDESRKNIPRMNGSYASSSHQRTSSHGGGEALVSPSVLDRKKDSGQHQYQQLLPHRAPGAGPSSHSRASHVRSPKKIRQLLGGPNLAKDKLEDGEPPSKKTHFSSAGELADLSQHSTELTPLDSAPHSLQPHDLKREPDYRKKARFLYTLQLEPVSPDRRKEFEFKQAVCEWDQIRRCKMYKEPPAPCSVDTVSLPYQYSATRLTQAVTSCLAEERNKKMLSSLELAGLTTTTVPASSAASATVKSSPSPTPPPTSATVAPPPPSSHPLSSRSVIYSPANGAAAAVTLPAGGPEVSASKPALSQDFAYEFHESVLQETRQQRAAQKGNHGDKSHQDVRYTLISDSMLPTSHYNRKAGPPGDASTQQLPSSLQSIQNMTSQLLTDHSATTSASAPPTVNNAAHQKGQTSPHSGSQHSSTNTSESSLTGGMEEGRWPGVEAIMMAYQKHLEEVTTEKQILQEQSEKLLTTHRELSNIAEDLSARMTDLLQSKRQAEEERTKHQSQLDSIRKQLSSFR